MDERTIPCSHKPGRGLFGWYREEATWRELVYGILFVTVVPAVYFLFSLFLVLLVAVLTSPLYFGDGEEISLGLTTIHDRRLGAFWSRISYLPGPGGVQPRGFAGPVSATVKPDITGMFTSRTAMSGWWLMTASSASPPLPASQQISISGRLDRMALMPLRAIG